MQRKLFINENTHAEISEYHLIIKNQESKKDIKLKRNAKQWHDLFRIKNSNLLAHVQMDADDSRVPVGRTELIDENTFKSIVKISVPLSRKSLVLKNDMLIGVSGQTVILYNLKLHCFTVFSLQKNILTELIAMNNDAFMALYSEQAATYHSIIPNELRCQYHFNIEHANSVIGLTNDRFLVQEKNNTSYEWKLYQKTDTRPSTLVLKKQSYDIFFEYKTSLFLPESELVIMLTKKGELFYLSLEDLNLHPIDFYSPQKIEDIFLGKQNQLFAIFADGTSFDFSIDFNSKNISRRLYDDVYYPHVLADIVAQYAGINFFHQKTPAENKIINPQPKIK